MLVGVPIVVIGPMIHVNQMLEDTNALYVRKTHVTGQKN